MSETKLLPCPFCCGQIKLDEDVFYMFCCDDCGAGITFAKEFPDGTAEDCSKEESIEKWNIRKPMDDIVNRIKKVGTKFCTSVHCNDNCEDCDHGVLMKAIIDIVRSGAILPESEEQNADT